MPLVVEDGTGIVGANSYITVDELRTYALDRGVSFTAAPQSGVDPAVAVYTPFLIRACDYIEAQRYQFAGYAALPETQELCFPRLGIYVNFNWQGAQELALIPAQLKKAQAQLVLEQLNGITILPSQAAIAVDSLPAGPNGAITAADGRLIIRDKLDVLETQWSDNEATLVPFLPAVDAYLRQLYSDSGMFYTGVRI